MFLQHKYFLPSHLKSDIFISFIETNISLLFLSVNTLFVINALYIFLTANIRQHVLQRFRGFLEFFLLLFIQFDRNQALQTVFTDNRRHT